MEQTLLPGDRIIVDMRYYSNQRSTLPGDLIIYQRDGTFFAKRLIAVGGSTVRGKDGSVFVDGKQLDEPYVHHIHAQHPELLVENLMDFGPIAIPPGKLFVMGDNRDVSYDSRAPDHGLVDTKELRGRVLYVYGPLIRAGRNLK